MPATFAAETRQTRDSRADLGDVLVLLGNLARVEVDPVKHLPPFRPLVFARCPRTTWKDESREVRLHERIVLERLEDVRLDADVARDKDGFWLPRDDAVDEVPACGDNGSAPVGQEHGRDKMYMHEPGQWFASRAMTVTSDPSGAPILTGVLSGMVCCGC